MKFLSCFLATIFLMSCAHHEAPPSAREIASVDKQLGFDFSDLTRVLCDDCSPQSQDLLKLAESYKNSEASRQEKFLLAENVMLEKLQYINDNIKYCGGADNCIRLMSAVEQKSRQVFTTKMRAKKEAFVLNRQILEGLVELAGKMSVAFSSDYERQGYWTKATRDLRMSIISKVSESITISVDLHYGKIFNHESNLSIDKIHSIDLTTDKLSIKSQNEIDPSCVLDNRQTINFVSDISIDLRNQKTDLEKAQVVQFLDQMKPVKIKCKQVFFENQHSGGYDQSKHEAYLTYKNEVSFSTDHDLGIFGGIYKSKYTRFYHTIFP